MSVRSGVDRSASRRFASLTFGEVLCPYKRIVVDNNLGPSNSDRIGEATLPVKGPYPEVPLCSI